MDPNIYRIIHILGIAAIALGLGGMMAGGNNRKAFAMLQGIGLLVVLVTGFGMAARIYHGFPHFAMVKVVLWLVLGMVPVIVRRLKLSFGAGIGIALTLITLLAWLGVVKPALW